MKASAGRRKTVKGKIHKIDNRKMTGQEVKSNVCASRPTGAGEGGRNDSNIECTYE
jgi:hypothetical protein